MAQRLDKWLVYARIVKHRSRALELVELGHVRINRERVVKPSHTVKPGDILTISAQGGVRVVKVIGEAERRGPPSSVANLYEALSQPA